jgi:hypothetical protein
MQQQKTSLGGNGQTDLIGNDETATSFEAFFREKYLDMTQKFRAIRRR